jgi:hypothetical protein
MTKARNQPTLMMGAATSLHGNDAARVAFHKVIKLSPRQLFAKHSRSIRSSAVQMKTTLAKSTAISVASSMDTLFVAW